MKKLIPIHICRPHVWRYLWKTRQWFGLFRGRGRWGFHILGLDIGRRG